MNFPESFILNAIESLLQFIPTLFIFKIDLELGTTPITINFNKCWTNGRLLASQKSQKSQFANYKKPVNRPHLLNTQTLLPSGLKQFIST